MADIETYDPTEGEDRERCICGELRPCPHIDDVDDDEELEESEEDSQPEPDGYCCDDCAVAIANDDYSGMDDAQEAATRAGLKREGWVVVGDEAGFMHSRCDICNGLPGNRHSFFLPENDGRCE